MEYVAVAGALGEEEFNWVDAERDSIADNKEVGRCIGYCRDARRFKEKVEDREKEEHEENKQGHRGESSKVPVGNQSHGDGT